MTLIGRKIITNSILWFLNICYLWKRLHCILTTGLKHILYPFDWYSNLVDYWIRYKTCYSDGRCGKTYEFWVSFLYCYNICLLIKRYFVWNTLAFEKAFCNCIYGSPSRIILGRDSKYSSGIYLFLYLFTGSGEVVSSLFEEDWIISQISAPFFIK